MKEKMCLYGVHMTTCPIFMWVSKGVLSLKNVYVSLFFFNNILEVDGRVKL